jgi:uncharacterized membrane protein YbhN (UPF0104 family)
VKVRDLARRAWPGAVAALCIAYAVFAFDWSAVAQGLLSMDFGLLLFVGVPLEFCMFAVRGLRWVAVTGLPLRVGTVWRAHCYVAVAVAAATATPMQIGEAVKIKFAERDAGLRVARSGLAYAMERVADIAALAAMLAVGLAANGAVPWPAAAAAAAAVAGLPAMPSIARRLAAAPLPARVRDALAPVAETRLPAWRLALLLACTVVKWAGVGSLWWVTLVAVGVRIDPAETALLVAIVTFAGNLSLVPGGLGVSEVSTRAVLVWYGVEPAAAETAAVALRLLSPLVMVLGAAHALVPRGRAAPADGAGLR